MIVYMIRHGQSTTNAMNRLTGWLDAPLTDKGRKDAEFARSILNGVHFDRVFSSDLVRARETAKIVLPDYEAELTPLLREINVGSLAGTTPAERSSPAMHKELWTQGYHSYGGESIEEFRARLLGFMNTVPSLGCEKVALFSHAGCLRVMLDEAVGCRHERKQVHCLNCTVEILEYKNDTWHLHSWINSI